MNYQDFLMTFAQIIGVIVGFANLASVFDRSKINEVHWAQNKVRILVITEGGILLIACCFIPYLMFFFTEDEYKAFKISTVVALILFLSTSFFSAYRYKGLTGHHGIAQKVILGASLLLNCTPLLIAAFVTLPLRQMIAFYCFSVFSVFFILSIIFIRLFRAIVT